MNTLIIILIVAMIAQTCVFIYANFIDLHNKREATANAEAIKAAYVNFNDEKMQFKENLKAKDEIIRQWIDKCNKLDFELAEARKVNGLLKNRTAYVEGLKDSFNRQAEAEWDGRGFIETGGNAEHLRFVEGMKAGAEWVAECVGIKVEFEIDDRHKED